MARGDRTGTTARAARTLLLAFLAAALPACFTPPAVAPAGFPDLRAIDFPPDAEFVELRVSDDTVLRGVFLSAGDGAPIVVHFPAMLESVTGGAHSDVAMLAEDGWLVARNDLKSVQISFQILQVGDTLDGEAFGQVPLEHGLFTELRRAGLSTLFVDYAGVGASTGTRSPGHLARDARAVWAEALRRADGDPQRVVLRGVSLGALAVAALLEDDVQPGAVSLAAPVRGESVVRNFARLVHGGFVATLADWFYADVGGADLQAAIARTSSALFLAVPEHDALIRDEERAELLRLAEEHGAQRLVLGEMHEQLALMARRLLPGELAFLETNLVALQRSRSERASALLAGLEADPLVSGKLRALDAAGHARLARLAALRPWPDARLPLMFAQRADGLALADALQTWCDWQDSTALAALPWNALEALVQLHDPLMSLDAAWVSELAPEGPALRATLHSADDLHALATRFATEYGNSVGASMSVRGAVVRLADPAVSLCWRAEELAADGQRAAGIAGRSVGPRIALRLALRAAGVPDRALHGDSGRVHEVWWDGAWVRVSGLAP